MNTDKTVELPFPIEYDIISGGACRDTLIGRKPRDYDIYYVDRDKYGRVIEELEAQGFNCQKAESFNKPTEVVRTVFLKSMEKGSVVYDMFLLNPINKTTNVQSVVEFVNQWFEFTVNTVYQEEGGMIEATEDAWKHIKDRALVPINDHGVEILLPRAIRMMEKGFKPSVELAHVLLERAEKMLKDVTAACERSGNLKSSKYVKVSSGYSETIRVRKSVFLDDLMKVLSGEYLVFAFMCHNNDILQHARMEYEKRVEPNTRKRWANNVRIWWAERKRKRREK